MQPHRSEMPRTSTSARFCVACRRQSCLSIHLYPSPTTFFDTSTPLIQEPLVFATRWETCFSWHIIIPEQLSPTYVVGEAAGLSSLSHVAVLPPFAAHYVHAHVDQPRRGNWFLILYFVPREPMWLNLLVRRPID